jgi:hypothetical protein
VSYILIFKFSGRKQTVNKNFLLQIYFKMCLVKYNRIWNGITIQNSFTYLYMFLHVVCLLSLRHMTSSVCLLATWRHSALLKCHWIKPQPGTVFILVI